jgi:hypothetical protein
MRADPQHEKYAAWLPVTLERLGIVLPKRMRMTEVDLPAVALSA